MTVPVATKHEKRPSAWSFLFQHVAAIFKGGHYTSNRPNGISGPDHLCNGDITPAIGITMAFRSQAFDSDLPQGRYIPDAPHRYQQLTTPP